MAHLPHVLCRFYRINTSLRGWPPLLGRGEGGSTEGWEERGTVSLCEAGRSPAGESYQECHGERVPLEEGDKAIWRTVRVCARAMGPSLVTGLDLKSVGRQAGCEHLEHGALGSRGQTRTCWAAGAYCKGQGRAARPAASQRGASAHRNHVSQLRWCLLRWIDLQSEKWLQPYLWDIYPTELSCANLSMKTIGNGILGNAVPVSHRTLFIFTWSKHSFWSAFPISLSTKLRWNFPPTFCRT